MGSAVAAEKSAVRELSDLRRPAAFKILPLVFTKDRLYEGTSSGFFLFFVLFFKIMLGVGWATWIRGLAAFNRQKRLSHVLRVPLCLGRGAGLPVTCGVELPATALHPLPSVAPAPALHAALPPSSGLTQASTLLVMLPLILSFGHRVSESHHFCLVRLPHLVRGIDGFQGRVLDPAWHLQSLLASVCVSAGSLLEPSVLGYCV